MATDLAVVGEASKGHAQGSCHGTRGTPPRGGLGWRGATGMLDSDGSGWPAAQCSPPRARNSRHARGAGVHNRCKGANHRRRIDMAAGTQDVLVGIVCGSRSDFPVMEKAVEILGKL